MKTTQKKVLVWIRCTEKGETLFLLLKTTAERGGFWQPVTGSVEEGESPEAAALREMTEETALKPLKALAPVAEPYEFESRRGPVREFPFLAEIDASKKMQVRLDPHEHTVFQWSSAESALELLKYESNARILREILKERQHA